MLDSALLLLLPLAWVGAQLTIAATVLITGLAILTSLENIMQKKKPVRTRSGWVTAEGFRRGMGELFKSNRGSVVLRLSPTGDHYIVAREMGGVRESESFDLKNLNAARKTYVGKIREVPGATVKDWQHTLPIEEHSG